jgi:plasmid stabilization system protein ParE
MKVIWLKAAQQQLDEIYDFVMQQSERAAINIYNNIIDEVDMLSIFPEIASLEPLLRKEVYTYRSLVVQYTYKVIYRIDSDSDEVIVTSIWDCRRNPKSLKKRITGQ